ncbi:SDR family NAD(P)-dependent oxidoreductase [Dongia mobilis]|uniref:SDR family NAD(P)-dependent oxidoreductase n=1 Tax=Dongia sp. TaxID=1977262 RepID=UPI0026EDB366
MADFDLTGQVALVTGASGDLGRHFAAVLAGAGAAIVLMARRGDVIAAEAERLRGLGHRAASVTGDITQAQGFNSAFAAAESELGPISLLVNNAGISLTTPSLDLADSDWDAVIDTNLKGAWLASHEAAQRWVKHKRPGNIINIASILGQRVANQTLPYAVSKAGLIQMTKALSLEWARHNIRVNALSPGYIRTALNEEFFTTEAGATLIKRIPQRRLGLPQDLDGPLLLLASSASAYMTGTVLTVDGGHLNSSL